MAGKRLNAFVLPGVGRWEAQKIHGRIRSINTCNPVFITVGLRLGVEKYYHYFTQFGLKSKTGVDLPGEAGTIMHKMEGGGACHCILWPVFSDYAHTACHDSFFYYKWGEPDYAAFCGDGF